MEARMHKFYYKKIETDCNGRFWNVSQFSKFIFVVCNVWYKFLEDTICLIRCWNFVIHNFKCLSFHTEKGHVLTSIITKT